MNNKENLQVILDCMSGIDGGIGYIKLRSLLADIEDKDTYESYRLTSAIRDLAIVIKALEKL